MTQKHTLKSRLLNHIVTCDKIINRTGGNAMQNWRTTLFSAVVSLIFLFVKGYTTGNIEPSDIAISGAISGTGLLAADATKS